MKYKFIILLIIILILYIIFINFLFNIDLTSYSVKDTRDNYVNEFSQESKTMFTVDVTVIRNRFYGKIYENNGLSKLYLFNLISIPLNNKFINFYYFHISFVILYISFIIVVIFYMKIRLINKFINMKIIE